jgi:hypothetical protein
MKLKICEFLGISATGKSFNDENILYASWKELLNRSQRLIHNYRAISIRI